MFSSNVHGGGGGLGDIWWRGTARRSAVRHDALSNVMSRHAARRQKMKKKNKNLQGGPKARPEFFFNLLAVGRAPKRRRATVHRAIMAVPRPVVLIRSLYLENVREINKVVLIEMFAQN